jgi:hypothetical protein
LLPSCSHFIVVAYHFSPRRPKEKIEREKVKKERKIEAREWKVKGIFSLSIDGYRLRV